MLGVDLHQPFLDRLADAAARAGLDDRVRTLAASMAELPLPDGGADLLWAEGSAYVMGFDEALRSWRRLLAPGGVLVLTEAEWTSARPAAPARDFWTAGYPAMRDTAGNVAAATAAGWRVAATYLLPDADWDAYYRPLAARIDELARAGTDPELLAVVGQEIEIRRDHAGDYGYTGYVLRPR